MNTAFFSKKFLIVLILLISISGIFLLLLRSKRPQIHESKTYSLTQQDMGSTIHTKINDTIAVSIPTSFNLTPTTQIDDGTILSQEKASYDKTTQSFTGIYKAEKPGTTYMYIVGKSVCPPQGFCHPVEILYLKTRLIVDQ